MSEHRWWKIGNAIADEAKEQSRLAAEAAVIAKDNLRESCRACGDLGDIARHLIAKMTYVAHAGDD